MTVKHWMLAVPTLLGLGFGARLVMNPLTTRGADRRIVDERFIRLEERLGYHLYAPTWLPHGGRVGNVGAMEGVYRVLQDFTDRQNRSLVFLAQERRSPERDAYHRRIFQDRAEGRADVNGRSAYLVTGSSGERRLFWNEPKTALILSSTVLTDQELLEVARQVR